MTPRVSTPFRAEPEKTLIMNELREVLLANACQIIVTTGQDDLATSYLGINLEEFSLGSMPGSFRETIAEIDLDHFSIARQISVAYDFALQRGSDDARTAFDEDDWNDLEIFVNGAPRYSFGGEPTPLANEESILRRVLDMALARMQLKHGAALTIRQLALLADIGEGAVRSALSAEGIRTEGKPAKVPAEVAEPWLRKRRGYVPTLERGQGSDGPSDTTRFMEHPFDEALQRVLADRGHDAQSLSKRTGADLIWLKALIEGGRAPCDVPALRSLARALSIDEPVFVGRAVEALIKRE